MMKSKIFCLFFVIGLMTSLFGSQQVKDIVVAQDGTGNFKTIQAAVNAVRDHMQSKAVIRIKAGTYNEKLVIPAWKKNIHLIGESKENTIISNDDYSGKPHPTTDFTGNTKYSTYTSYTVLVQGSDCIIENLTIENTAGPVGQAVALNVEADRFAARNCNFFGNQDTLYLSKDGKNYFDGCIITGTTDFIFGEATAVFYKCIIKSLSNSYITAASTTKEQAYGFVFLNCELIASPAVSKVFLGRPWRPFARTVFIGCKLGEHIVAEGWHAWPGDPLFADKEKTAFYAEYANTGNGANTNKRVLWAKQLTKKEIKTYTIQNIFKNWMPNFQLTK